MAHVNVTDAQSGLLYLKNVVLKAGKLTPDLISMLIKELKNSPSSRNIVVFHTGGGSIAQV